MPRNSQHTEEIIKAVFEERFVLFDPQKMKQGIRVPMDISPSVPSLLSPEEQKQFHAEWSHMTSVQKVLRQRARESFLRDIEEFLRDEDGNVSFPKPLCA